LSLLLNPHDEVAFKKAIKTPSRGIGEKNLAKLMFFRQQKKISLIEACEQQTIAGKVGLKLKEFALKWHLMRTLINEYGLEVCLLELCELYGLNAHYQERDRIEGTERLIHLGELASMMSIYPAGLVGLSQFIENMSLKNSGEENSKDAKVTLITIHNTKGLEYHTVIIVGMEEQLFPRVDMLDLDHEEQLEEERRLCYVAITRAQKKLHLTYCHKRVLYGKTQYNLPSRFLYELPHEHFTEQVHGLVTPAPEAKEEDNLLGRFSVQSLVRHTEYGVGKIISSTNTNTHLVLEVVFQGSNKPIKLLPTFTHLEPVHPNELE
jgi:DNA helicase-2/ATP-dependent DNA helicase PcrA